MSTLAEVQDSVNYQVYRDYECALSERTQSLTILGLAEEAGEVAGLMKRQLRNNSRDVGKVTRVRYIEELGDVLWYLAACCDQVGTSLEEIWDYNKIKLERRYGNAECDGQCEFPSALYHGEN